MVKYLFIVLIFISSVSLGAKEMSIYDFEVKNIGGKSVALKKYKGKVLLIVNVASECGLTYQYQGLQELFSKYRKQGFMILGFPSNQFSNQEPGTNKEIKFFCSSKYNVSFDMFSKIDVNGDNADPLYKFLKKQQGGFLGFDSIKWNFTKFLVDRDGNVVQRYSPSKNPQALETDIEQLLQRK
jgi:glutathione peroxidase